MAESWQEIVEQVLSLQEVKIVRERKAPAVQWYPKQLLADEAYCEMSWAARGIHLHLINLAWDQKPPCSIPGEVRRLRGICNHPPSFEELWEEVRQGWKEYKGRWWQIGLCRSYVQLMYRRAAAKESAKVRWEKEQRQRLEKERVGCERIQDGFERNHTFEKSALELQFPLNLVANAAAVDANATSLAPIEAKNDALHLHLQSSTLTTSAAATRACDCDPWLKELQDSCDREIPGLLATPAPAILALRDAGLKVQVLTHQIHVVAERQRRKGDPVQSWRYLEPALLRAGEQALRSLTPVGRTRKRKQPMTQPAEADGQPIPKTLPPPRRPTRVKGRPDLEATFVERIELLAASGELEGWRLDLARQACMEGAYDALERLLRRFDPEGPVEDPDDLDADGEA